MASKYKPVVQNFIRTADKIYQLTYEDGTVIETTWSHPFYIEWANWKAAARSMNCEAVLQVCGWVKAEELRAGDVSKTDKGTLRITNVHVDVRSEEVYNFHVSTVNTYMVSEQAVVVHNQNPYGCMDAWCLYGMLVQPIRATKEQVASALRSLSDPEQEDTLGKLAYTSCWMPTGVVCTAADVAADIIEGKHGSAAQTVAISSAATLLTGPWGGRILPSITKIMRKVPKSYIAELTSKKTGLKLWTGGKDNIIRIMPGDVNSPNPLQQSPYVKWTRNGKMIGRDGSVQPSGKTADSHIPLKDFLPLLEKMGAPP